MADDEYYYEDEQYVYDDDGDVNGNGGEEETWETAVENKYANAKSCIDSSPAEAIASLIEVLQEDQDAGKWSFKSYKMLARACQRHRRYDEMIQYLEKVLTFQFPERTRMDTEKALHKFLERCSIVPPETMERVYLLSIRELEKDLRTFEKLWLSVSIKYVELLLLRCQYDAVLERVGPLKEWCGSGENAMQRKSTQLIHLLAIEIQVYTEKQDNTRLRDLYALATHTMEHAIAPPRVGGIIKECGGKMFLRQGLWNEAHEAFGQAFRCFDDAGDARRLTNLKYLVLSSMLSAAKIDPFASNETKSFQNDPEIRSMTELIHACQNNDVKSFDRILRDKRHSQTLLEDPLVYKYLQPLIRRVRLQVLVQLITPYRRIRLSKIAEALSVPESEAEALCVAVILDGAVDARIDQSAGIVLVGTAPDATDHDMLEMLQQWTETTAKSSEQSLVAVMSRN
jgi:COP9 signalosome complex subunit 2